MKRTDIITAITNEPKKTRKRRPKKQLPEPYKEGQLVIVESPHQFTGKKLGWIMRPCKFDAGVIVYLVESTDDNALYRCIQPDKGDKVVLVNEKTKEE